MKRIRLINLILIMFCCCNMLAQNITVTGQVVDVTSEPIIGASVVVKGTANGTITNFDWLVTHYFNILCNISYIRNMQCFPFLN